MTASQWSAFGDGTILVLELTFIAIVVGLILGLLLALCKISKNKVLGAISWIYIWIFRGTPLLMQIMVVFYALPIMSQNLIGHRILLTGFQSAALALSLNSGAYLAEIIRGGIESIDKGQMEAAKALGMTYGQAMRKIIIPQSYKRLMPPIGNEFIILIKDTSLVSAIGLSDLLRNAKIFTNATGQSIYYAYAAIIYLALTSLFTIIFQMIEKQLGKSE